MWSALVQLDADDEAEVITLGANLVLSDDDGTTLIRSPTFARNWSGGPCVGDFDGDGQPELAYGAYDGFYVWDVDVRNVWYAPIDVANYAGQAACAGYDLDADGALEVLYADEHAFRIHDGRTGAVNFQDDGNYESRAARPSPRPGYRPRSRARPSGRSRCRAGRFEGGCWHALVAPAAEHEYPPASGDRRSVGPSLVPLAAPVGTHRPVPLLPPDARPLTA